MKARLPTAKRGRLLLGSRPRPLQAGARVSAASALRGYRADRTRSTRNGHHERLEPKRREVPQ
jgi:hypothetical protein